MKNFSVARKNLNILFKHRRWRYITEETKAWFVNKVNDELDSYYGKFDECVDSRGFFVLKLDIITIFENSCCIEYVILVGDDVIVKRIPIHHKVNVKKLFYHLKFEFEKTKVKLVRS